MNLFQSVEQMVHQAMRVEPKLDMLHDGKPYSQRKRGDGDLMMTMTRAHGRLPALMPVNRELALPPKR